VSQGDDGKKDIRQRADEFLQHGVLGCCPETKAALGKTIAESGDQKQPEKALPNVVSAGGRRYDKTSKWEEGMELHLFPGAASRNALHGQPNFGWMPAKENRERSQEEINQEFADSLIEYTKKPRVVQEVWEVDDDGNPTKRVKPDDDKSDDEDGDDEDEEEEGVKGKGLGRTLRELNPGNTLIARAAKRFGVWMDDLGKFRCPPGTPQANQFTDEFGTTCFAVSASQIANAAQQGFASLGSWYGKWRQRRMPFYIDEFGNVTENVDIIEGRQETKRVFTGARARVRAVEAATVDLVDDLLREHGITPDATDNKDLKTLIEKLSDKAGKEILVETIPDIDKMWNRLPEARRRELESRGINKEALRKSERGFLMQIVRMAIEDPENFAMIDSVIYKARPNDDPDNEAYTRAVFPETRKHGRPPKISEMRTEIEYNPLKMADNVVNQLEDVREHQRLGLRVVGAGSDEEAADVLHKFVVNESQWAGGMTASLGKDPFLTKGMHTAAHEGAHVKQVRKFVAKAMEIYGSDAGPGDLSTGNVVNVMIGMGDEIDIEDLGLVLDDFDKVAFIGGRYGRDTYGQRGAVDELWRLETAAELYALRQMGVIEGDDVDAAISWMDSGDEAKDSAKRRSIKRKRARVRERDATRPMPDDVPSDKPKDKKRRARRVPDAAGADKVGKSIRKSTMDRLDKGEKEAVERVGDPRRHSVMALSDPANSEHAIMSIDAGHRLARRHGVDLQEVDVSGSRALSRVAYDDKKKRLYVTYKDKDGNPGRTYYYKGVEAEEFLALYRAESKGKEMNRIKATHEVSDPLLKGIPAKIDMKSLEDGDIAQQIQFNLIPTLTALDKSQVGMDMRVVVTVPKDKRGGESVTVKGITTARIYHDGMSMNDDEVVLSIPSDARGIPVDAGAFDREPDGSTSLLMMPPMKIAVLDEGDGRVAELTDQEFSDTTLERILDEWPHGSGEKDGRKIAVSKRKAEEVIATHLAAGEGKGELPDGRTAPIGVRRIRTRNADVHARQTAKRSSPTKPTKAYRDSVTTRGRGFSSMGKIETQEERNFSRMSGATSILPSIRDDASVDPEVRRALTSLDDRQVSQLMDDVAFDFHQGVDRRPRIRVSEGELGKVVSDGGRYYKDSGHFSSAERQYQSLIGIHPDVDDIDRPIAAYVVHPSQDSAAREAMRRRGVQVGDAPIEWPRGSNPHGDVDADGDIEIVLKPEVSGRTAYGFGYGMDEKTRPVWMNSSDHAAVADAIVHVDPASDPEGSRRRMMNVLSASVDGEYGSITDVGSVRPASTRQNERTSAYAARLDEHGKAARPQRLGAQVMGGFVNEEISEVRYPWSRVVESSSDMDISDVVNKEPVSDRLRRLGFSDAEIEYFYKVNGDRSLDYLSSSTMASLKEYRKAMQIKNDYEARGIPSVTFPHPSGMDPLDVDSYSANGASMASVEDALAKAINEEVDALLEKMLKQVRKTRGKIWEMKPKVGAAR